ncbi:MAG: hypothetical protein V3V02_07035 [Rhizobiaceae bacterium]
MFTLKSLFVAAVSLPLAISASTTSYAADGEPAGYLFGSVEIFGGGIKLTEGSGLVGTPTNEPVNAKFYGGALKAGYGFNNGILVVGELFTEKTNTGSADDSYASGFSMAGHLAYQRDDWLFGAFGGRINTDQDNNNNDTSIRHFYGIEGQYYWENVTLMAQLGRLGGTGGTDDSGEDSIYDATFFKVGVNWFVQPDTMLSAHFSGARGVMGDKTGFFDRAHKVTTRNWGVRAEHQFTFENNIKFSVYAKYDISYYDERPGESDHFDERTWMVGLKIKFNNSDSLRASNRRGETLEAPRELVRWVAQTGGPGE